MHIGEALASPCDAPGPRWRDWVLALAGAFILTDSFDATLYIAFGIHAKLLPGLPVVRVPLLAVLLVAAVLLASDPRRAARYIRAAWLLWPPVVLTFVSATWSEQPATTLFWATGLLVTSAFGLALAVRFSARSQAVLTAVTATSIALVSAVGTLLWPMVAIGPNGRWRGVYLHKNFLGRVMALGVAATAASTVRGWRRVSFLAALLLCAGVLLKTQSRTAILAALIAVVAAMLLLAARMWRRHAAVLLVGGVAAVVLAVAFLLTSRPGLALLGRNSATLGDRTAIWKAVVASTSGGRWIGHGYGAFWGSSAASTMKRRVGTVINQAHNGAVDLYAELGVAGLILVLVPLGMFSVAAVRHALEPGAHVCIWPATYLVFFVASNAGESALLRHKLYWALYVAAACHVAARGFAPRSMEGEAVPEPAARGGARLAPAREMTA